MNEAIESCIKLLEKNGYEVKLSRPTVCHGDLVLHRNSGFEAIVIEDIAPDGIFLCRFIKK
jgi:CheY-specific phosphatase CheX